MKRCETCKFWIIVYESKAGYLFDEDDKERTGSDDNTEYGRCKKAFFKNDSSEENEMNTQELATKGEKMFVEDGEGFFAALYTHRDHCCRCWEEKGAKGQRDKVNNQLPVTSCRLPVTKTNPRNRRLNSRQKYRNSENFGLNIDQFHPIRGKSAQK